MRPKLPLLLVWLALSLPVAGRAHDVTPPSVVDALPVADAFTRVDLSAGYHHERFEVAFALENLLNTKWRESQFATVSRLRNETSCQNGSQADVEGGNFAGCDDLHSTPGAPIAVRGSAALYF